jgi:hypothetical protein
VSLTVTVNVQVDVLAAASVAVTVTVVVPFGKTDPEAGLETTVRLEQLSVALTVKLTTAEQRLGAVEVMMLAGQLKTGTTVSFTVTLNEQLEEFAAASLTVQVTVLLPSGNVEPDGGLHTGIPTPGQLSLTFGS